MVPCAWLMGCLVVQAGGAEHPPEFACGGCGGAYFLAEPGELVVRLEKRDRNRSGAPTELRAILFGPDRQVLDEQAVPFAGGAKGSGLGPPGRVTLSTQVVQPGVYGLNLTVSTDRYGDDIVWGFWTNCRRYLIETARGHRDARHEEPIVLLDPERSANICFLPRSGAFALQAGGLPDDAEALTVYDAQDGLVARVPVADGKAEHTFAADPDRGSGPWRLHLPRGQGVINLDGLTRWEGGDLLPDQCLWTPDRSSWFDWQANRWLLTPYRIVRHGPAGATGQVTFEVYNHATRERTVALALEYPGEPWPVSLDRQEVTLGPRSAADVTATYTLPAAGERVVNLRATSDDGDFSTWSSLAVAPGEAPTGATLALPLTLLPYHQAREQFGYAPNYPLDNQPYFDLDNRPAVCTSRGLATGRDGVWRTTDLASAVVERIPAFDEPIGGPASQKVAFDRDGDLYLLASAGRKQLLLHSSDAGRTFRAYVIPGREDRARALDLEQLSGHNLLSGPPPIARNTAVPTERDPKLFWRRVNELDLFVPRKVGDRIELGEPIRVSGQSLGLSGHSGTPSALVSRGDKVHIVWGEATDPADKVPGVPTFVATYDRATGRLGQPVLVGYGAPANDVHNTPSITMDSQGYLHVLTGTHGRPFQYARSLRPNDSEGGFTPAEPTGDGLSQTYIGLVCGRDDSLHLVYRLNRSREAPYPLSYHTALTYQRKRPGQPWEPPRLLVLPPFSEYSIYYHRLTIDRRGNLFLSYDYWSTFWFYRNDVRSRGRTVLTSEDDGETWRLW